ncbi:MAG: hypothetical protein ACP5N1_01465 [Candidatus Woesearchaeota archaeon]
MYEDIEQFFNKKGMKIISKDLNKLENIILKKIMSTKNHPVINNLLNKKDLNSTFNLRECFINPDFYGVMTSKYFEPEIITLKTISDSETHYEGIILNNIGFGLANIEKKKNNIEIQIEYLDLYFGMSALKTECDLETLDNENTLKGTWKHKEANKGVFGFTYGIFGINEDLGIHPTTKDFNGQIYFEKNNKSFSEKITNHPVIINLLINNYKHKILELKTRLDQKK